MAIYRGPGGSGDATTDAASQATVATTKAAEAAASASAASSSATTAGTEASNASTSASNSATSATASASSATASASSATAAASSATAAAASFDSFDDRYLGAKSSAPSTDNDGNALAEGTMYYDTGDDIIYVWNGSTWQTITTGSGGLQAANNLSDVASASTSRTNLGLAIGSNVQAHSAVLDATTASYTTAEETKLAGIETAATADQSAAEIKTAYESNADTNAFTDADHTKLDGIEASATADQSAAEIKTAYESNADTNAFTDADHTKLDGIEASADVTDATNVTAAGALMDSEVTNLAQVKAFNSADYATAAQGTLAASALQSSDIGSTVQGFDADTLKADTADTLTAPFRGTVTTDNDLSFDLNVTNNFKCTPSGAGTLTFTNHTDGQSGFVWLDNSGGHAIAAAATTKINAADLTTISTAGVYTLSYFDNGTNAYVAVSRSFA
jgi:hypothetical protein